MFLQAWFSVVNAVGLYVRLTAKSRQNTCDATNTVFAVKQHAHYTSHLSNCFTVWSCSDYSTGCLKLIRIRIRFLTGFYNLVKDSEKRNVSIMRKKYREPLNARRMLIDYL